MNVSELDRLKGYELGAIDYIAVPVVPEILRSKVAVLVELHQRRELKRLNESPPLANAKLDKANQELQREKARELAALNRSHDACSVTAPFQIIYTFYREAITSSYTILYRLSTRVYVTA